MEEHLHEHCGHGKARSIENSESTVFTHVICAATYFAPPRILRTLIFKE
jgi:hypothetical protein